MRRFLTFIAILIVLVGVLAIGGGFWFLDKLKQPGPLAKDVTVMVPRGAGVTAIADRLQAAGVIQERAIFSAAARYYATEKSLKAGEYKFRPQMSILDVIRLIQSGKTQVRRLTFAEGLTSWTILKQIEAAPDLSGLLSQRPGEGALLPETYHFTKDDSRDAMVARMKKDMDIALQTLWDQREKGLPLKNKAEALILASIVEKETGLAAERAEVAGVFINRLRKGMKLQSDPTVIYALTQGQGDLGRSLTRNDLTSKSPYNTYVHKGLPPGPICNPGKASIAAVLNPAKTKNYYFVADGTGGHAFARTLKEHNANVRKWRRIQRERGLR